MPPQPATGSLGGFICGPGRKPKACRWCGLPSTKLCDKVIEPDGAGGGKTCDAPMCPGCSTPIGPNRDLCPDHKG